MSSCVATVTAVQNGAGFLNRVRSTHANRGYEGVASVGRFEKAETPVSPGEVRVRIDVSGLYELAR